LLRKVPRSEGCDLGRPCRWNCVVRQLDNVQRVAVRRSKGSGVEEELLARGVGILLRERLLFRRGVNGYVQAAFGALRRLVFANQNSSGKARVLLIAEGVAFVSRGDCQLRGRG